MMETGVKSAARTLDTMRMRLLSAALLLPAVVAAACGGGTEQASSSTPAAVIAIDGSSTVYPISEAMAEDFGKTDGAAPVTVAFTGTGGGFKKFCRGETVVSDASRPISASELEACGQASIGFVELPVAYDGLAVVVNPKNTWATSMTVAELKKLWAPEAQGKVMKWSQIRAGWPDKAINLYGAGTDSGTFDYFTEAIVGTAKKSRGDYTSSENDNVLVQGVSGDEYALGYMGLAYYEENRGRLTLLGIDDENPANGAGPIQPSFDVVRNGTYRPLSRPLFIYLSINALAARPEVQKFADFYLNNAAAISKEVGYVSLTDAELALVKARLAAHTTGTMFAEHAAQSQKSLTELLQGRQ
jgi:phosphate transport system substrate-binding protein